MSCDYQSATLDHKAKVGSPSGQRPLAAIRTTGRPSVPPREIRLIPIASIRTDGDAQHRISPDQNIVEEYAGLMRAGVEFPPISVRFDGTDYWPADGFQRFGAAKLARFSEIRAEIRPGTKEDAQWDSYAANASHGLRRTPAETERVVRLALQHPNAAKVSNVQIAKHLHTPESTVRYWRDRLSSQVAKMSVREVTRGGVTYHLTRHSRNQTGCTSPNIFKRPPNPHG